MTLFDDVQNVVRRVGIGAICHSRVAFFGHAAAPLSVVEQRFDRLHGSFHVFHRDHERILVRPNVLGQAHRPRERRPPQAIASTRAPKVVVMRQLTSTRE